MKIICSLVLFALFIVIQCEPSSIYYGNGMSVRSAGHHGMVFTGILSRDNKHPTPKQPDDLSSISDESVSAEDNAKDTDMPKTLIHQIYEKGTGQEDEEDVSPGLWPFVHKTKKQVPRYPSISFFPIGNIGRSASSVAIANSFSTGNSGVANSFATVYTGPNLRTPVRTKHEQEPKCTTCGPSTITPIIDVRSFETTTSIDTTTSNEELTTSQEEISQEETTEEDLPETTTSYEETTTEFSTTTESTSPTTFRPTRIQKAKEEPHESEEIFPLPKTTTVQFFPVSLSHKSYVVAPIETNNLNKGKSNSLPAHTRANIVRYVQRHENLPVQSTSKRNTCIETTTANDFLIDKKAQMKRFERKAEDELDNSTTKVEQPIRNYLPSLMTANPIKENSFTTTEETINDSEVSASKKLDSAILKLRPPLKTELNENNIPDMNQEAKITHDEESPSNSISIANSFSTGRNGVATSNSKAFGRQDLTQNSRFKMIHVKIQPTTEDIFKLMSTTTENYHDLTTEGSGDISTDRYMLTTEYDDTTNIFGITTPKSKFQSEEYDDTTNIFGLTTLKPKLEPEVKKAPHSNVHALHSYFPIDLLGAARSRNNIAISNSFSTGRGGNAISSATAYGQSFFSRNYPRRS